MDDSNSIRNWSDLLVENKKLQMELQEEKDHSLSTKNSFSDILRLRDEKIRRLKMLLAEALKRAEAYKVKSEHFENRAQLDPLTGIANRGKLEEELGLMYSVLSRQPGSVLTVAMVDIDNFKKINDNYGHPFGDKVLIKVSETEDLYFRRGNQRAGRWGGEEFLVILNESEEVSRLYMERSRLLVEGVRFDEYPDLRVTVSIGVASLSFTGNSRPSITKEELVKRADDALYRAKADGRNCVRVYEQVAESQ